MVFNSVINIIIISILAFLFLIGVHFRSSIDVSLLSSSLLLLFCLFLLLIMLLVLFIFLFFFFHYHPDHYHHYLLIVLLFLLSFLYVQIPLYLFNLDFFPCFR